MEDEEIMTGRESFKTRQLTEYKTIKDGRGGCLFLVGPEGLSASERCQTREPRLYFLESEIRKEDKRPYVDALHTKERELLQSSAPLLEGYPAWLAAYCIEATSDKEGGITYPCYNEYRAGMGELDIFVNWFGKSESEKYDFFESREPNVLREIMEKKEFGCFCLAWRYGLNEAERKAFVTDAVCDEEGRLDYGKALLSASFSHYPYCPITLDEKHKLQLYIYENTFYGMLTDADEKPLQDDLSEDELGAGFVVALVNLARNKFVYDFSRRAPNTRNIKTQLFIHPEDLSFDFDYDVKTLNRTYYEWIKEETIGYYSKNPTLTYAKADEVDLTIYIKEKEQAEQFFNDSLLKSYFNVEQLEQLKDYVGSFFLFMVSEILSAESLRLFYGGKEAQTEEGRLVANLPDPDEELLKDTFVFKYRQTNDYQMLIDCLCRERLRNDHFADSDWARYALAIYDNKVTLLRNRPNTFKEWLMRFCQIFGREYVRDYEMEKLRKIKRKNVIDAFLPVLPLG